MLQSRTFYGLWAVFIFSAMAGLMTIGIIKLVGIDTLQKSGHSVAQASAIAGTAMGLFFAIANGLGRILWGTISDLIGRKRSLTILTLTQGAMMLLFPYLARNEYLLYLGATAIGFNFGGNFALFPTVTADFFGTKSVGLNYGWMFTAYGIGGIVGPLFAGYTKDTWKNFQAAFVVAGIACLVASILAMALTTPLKKAKTRDTSVETEGATSPIRT